MNGVLQDFLRGVKTPYISKAYYWTTQLNLGWTIGYDSGVDY